MRTHWHDDEVVQDCPCDEPAQKDGHHTGVFGTDFIYCTPGEAEQARKDAAAIDRIRELLAVWVRLGRPGSTTDTAYLETVLAIATRGAGALGDSDD
jgi:hypothetical protein